MYKDIKEEDVNYVIIQDNGKPVVWSDNNLPVIYGGVEDAEMDSQEGDKIVTLGEYAKSIGVDYKTLISY
jgi:hypothetical protein